MEILVDYDNVEYPERRRGVEHVVRKIASTVERAVDPADSRLNFRLYGGWYEGGSLSRAAQLILTDIRNHFPQPLFRSDSTPLGVANVELANSLLCDRSTLVTHTYRARSLQPSVKCQTLPWLNCADKSACPLSHLFTFFDSGLCPHGACPILPEDVLYKPEQKLVDTMLVADILHHSKTRTKCTVVSSDDDIWPGIKAAIMYGSEVVHILTKKTPSPTSVFISLRSAQYNSIQMV